MSNFGFLKFRNTADLEDFKKFATESTHGELQEYLSSIGFISLGATLYEEAYRQEIVREDEVIDYVYNTHHVFQLENVILKPIRETNNSVKWQFLLAMTEEFLTRSSYEMLIGGQYDEGSMNKFATNPEGTSFDLIAFMNETPRVFEQTTANSSSASRPFWGWHTLWHEDWHEGDCVVTYAVQRHCIFLDLSWSYSV